MSSSPSFTRLEITGMPGEVDRLALVLSATAEVVFHSRTEPDERGEVAAVIEVVTHPGHDSIPEPAPEAGVVTVALQAVVELDLSKRAGLSAREVKQEVEQESARLLCALPGSAAVQTLVVSARPARASRPGTQAEE